MNDKNTEPADEVEPTIQPEDGSAVVDMAKKLAHLTNEGIKKATPVAVKSAKKGAHLVAVGGRKGAGLAVAGAVKAKDLVMGFWAKATEDEAPLNDPED
jgi:predicted Rossmann-fold nucleotide-binding protein